MQVAGHGNRAHRVPCVRSEPHMRYSPYVMRVVVAQGGLWAAHWRLGRCAAMMTDVDVYCDWTDSIEAKGDEPREVDPAE